MSTENPPSEKPTIEELEKRAMSRLLRDFEESPTVDNILHYHAFIQARNTRQRQSAFVEVLKSTAQYLMTLKPPTK